MPFNPSAFGSGFAGGADTAASGSGAFYSGGFGSGFAGGVDGTAGTGGAFDSAGFGSGFYGGADTTPGTLSRADIDAIAAAVWVYAARSLTRSDALTLPQYLALKDD